MRETVEKGWGVPQRFAATMREIWQLQPQFDYTRGARPHKMLAQARFRAAYDFLVLRGEVGEVERDLVEWWTKFQHTDAEARVEMTLVTQQRRQHGQGDGADGKPNRKRRRSRKKKPAADKPES